MLSGNKTKKIIKNKFDLFKMHDASYMNKPESDSKTPTEPTESQIIPIKTTFPDSTKNITSYTYPFIDSLPYDIDDIDITDKMMINLCVYQVNTNGKKPFLEFLLYKYSQTSKDANTLVLPYFTYKISSLNVEEQANKKMKTMFTDVVKYKGFMLENKTCTLFYQHHFDKQLNIPKLTQDNKWWWATSCEIFNYKSVLHFNIHTSALNLFYNDPNILFLYKDKQIIEVPLILYNGSHYKSTAFMAVFGIKKGSIYASLGPYYYFSTFVRAMRYACYDIFLKKSITSDGQVLTVNDTGKYNEGGVVRFAVFQGKTKVFMDGDPPDTSAISLDTDKLSVWARNLSLRDTDGNWAKEYTCAYVGEYTFMDDENVERTRAPFWTLKNYEQQTPLSYHKINMSSVPDSFDSSYTNYKIE